MSLRLNRRYLEYFFEPVAESFEEGFWEAIKRRELVFQRCKSCGEWLHPPRPMCHRCKSYQLEWVKSSGRGRIYSWVTFTREVNPLYRVPFEVVLVEMEEEEGVRLVANMVDCEPGEITFDMPVELDFFEVSPDQPLPVFRKAANRGRAGRRAVPETPGP